MMRLGLHLCGVMAGLAVSPALACSPAEIEPSARPVVGEACAISYAVLPYLAVGLAEAEALPGGFVMQQSFEGNGCSYDASLLVTDCNTGQMVVLGSVLHDVMLPESRAPMERLQDRLRKSAAAGRLTLDRAASFARRQGMDKSGGGAISGAVTMGDMKFALDCGCKLFHPEAGGS